MTEEMISRMTRKKTTDGVSRIKRKRTEELNSRITVKKTGDLVSRIRRKRT